MLKEMGIIGILDNCQIVMLTEMGIDWGLG